MKQSPYIDFDQTLVKQEKKKILFGYSIILLQHCRKVPMWFGDCAKTDKRCHMTSQYCCKLPKLWPNAMVALCDVSVGILWEYIDSDCNQSQKVFTQENPDSIIKAVFIYAHPGLIVWFVHALW